MLHKLRFYWNTQSREKCTQPYSETVQLNKPSGLQSPPSAPPTVGGSCSGLCELTNQRILGFSGAVNTTAASIDRENRMCVLNIRWCKHFVVDTKTEYQPELVIFNVIQYVFSDGNINICLKVSTFLKLPWRLLLNLVRFLMSWVKWIFFPAVSAAKLGL